MAAIRALYGTRVELIAEEKNLHFSEFEGTKHAAQAGGAVAIPLRLAENFTHQVLAACVLPVMKDAIRILTDLFVRGAGDVSSEVSQQALPHVGMEMRFELGPDAFLATDDQ